MKYGAVSRHLVGVMGWSLQMIAESLLRDYRECGAEHYGEGETLTFLLSSP
jgi:hypothetical protein